MGSDSIDPIDWLGFVLVFRRDYDSSQSLFGLYSSMSFGSLLKRLDFINN